MRKFSGKFSGFFTTGGMIDRVRYEVTIVTFLAEKKATKTRRIIFGLI